MIVVDTNVLVRYAVKDDRTQALQATAFLKQHPCRLLKTVLLEFVWVLSSSAGYKLPRAVVAERVRHVCGLPTIDPEDASSVAQAVIWYEQGMDFADALHLAASRPFEGVATFDRQLSVKAGKLSDQKLMLLS